MLAAAGQSDLRVGAGVFFVFVFNSAPTVCLGPPRTLLHRLATDSPPAQPAAPKKTRGGAAFEAALALAAPAAVAGSD